LPTIAVPFLVRNVFEPVEVGHGGVVEEHVDSAEASHRKINQCPTVAWPAQITWLQGDHRSSRAANRLDGGFRSVDLQAAADDRAALTSEG
jgi:hypothetical protein